jgi:hypothetical protein
MSPFFLAVMPIFEAFCFVRLCLYGEEPKKDVSIVGCRNGYDPKQNSHLEKHQILQFVMRKP